MSTSIPLSKRVGEDVQSVITASGDDESPSLRALLDDALAQLDVARHQRTEVSAELFKCRCTLDELKEQKAQLQTEMTRRLTTHKDDVERIQSMQRELDKVRSSYTSKETEIIELSTRIQELVSKLESTEQHRELKEENELLWRKLDEMKRDVTSDISSSLVADRWRDRYSQIETRLSEAYHLRVPISKQKEHNTEDVPFMLDEILEAEESLRKSLTGQVVTLRIDLRKSQDELEAVKTKIASHEVATVKASISQDQETERKLRQELEGVRAELMILKSHRSEDMKSKVGALEAEILKLRSDKQAIAMESEHQINRIRTELASAYQDRSLVTQSDTVRQLNAANEKLCESQAECRRLQTEIDCLKQAALQEREEFKEGQAEWWRVEKGLKDKANRLQDQLKKVAEKDKDRVTAERDYIEKQELRERYEIEVRNMRHDLEMCESRVKANLQDQHDRELETLRSELAACESRIREEVQESHESQVESLRSEIQAWQDKADTSHCHIEELQSSQEALEERYRSLEEEREELLSKRLRLEESTHKLAEERDSCKLKISELEERVRVLSDELSEAVEGPSIASLVAELNQERLSPEQQVIRLKGALTRAQEAKRDASDMVAVLQMKIDDSVKETEGLKAQMAKIEEGWKHEYDVYIANLSRVSGALDKAVNEKKQADIELQTLRNKVNALTTQKQTPKGATLKGAKESTLKGLKETTTLESTFKQESILKGPTVTSTIRSTTTKQSKECGTNPEPVSDSSSLIVPVKFIGLMVILCWLFYWLGQIAH